MLGQTEAQLHLEPVVVTERSTVLIIEDDLLQVDLLQDGLTRQGFQVLSAATGDGGLRIARSDHPDVVLLDLGLPDQNGLALCEQLGDDPETNSIPIIVLTGNSEDDIVKQARLRGARYFLHKPFDPNTLLLLINKAIEDRQNW